MNTFTKRIAVLMTMGLTAAQLHAASIKPEDVASRPVSAAEEVAREVKASLSSRR